MSQILICENCGARIEIEDSDDLLPVTDSRAIEDENLQDIILCENCAEHNLPSKT